jgi:uncharacterized membrane protein YjjP (DUF1212 family)
MQTEAPQPDTRPLLEFMYRLAQAYLACGEQTALIELSLRRIAAACGFRRSRVVAFPTAIFITLHGEHEEHVTLAEGPLQSLRLDQIGAVYTLGDAAQRGEVSPEEGLKRLGDILRSRPRFGAAGAVVGHVVLTVGLAMILAPSIANFTAAAALGAIVGLLKVFYGGRAVLAAPVSVVAALVVSLLVFLAVGRGAAVSPFCVLVPPLVTFLPGAMLTFGMVELAYGDMVSGASRLISGLIQLVLLAFGLAAGATLAGVGYENLLATTGELAIDPWMPWLGVLVFAIGVHLHFSAPRNALPWMLLVMAPTFAAQRLAASVFPSEISGFFGTLVATPLVYLIQQRFQGPPSMVTFLPSFWLLVPGSLSLLSVTKMLSDRQAGFDGLIGAVFAIASIALGTLVGASLYKWLTETLGLWQLQVGRAGPTTRSQRE